jgi:growth factor-regulated tyrosine kinase substrate
MDLFIISVKSQLEIFVNRIKSNLSRGRTVINGGSLETFYSKITPMHQKLLQYIQQQDEKRCKFNIYLLSKFVFKSIVLKFIIFIVFKII